MKKTLPKSERERMGFFSNQVKRAHRIEATLYIGNFAAQILGLAWVIHHSIHLGTTGDDPVKKSVLLISLWMTWIVLAKLSLLLVPKWGRAISTKAEDDYQRARRRAFTLRQ